MSACGHKWNAPLVLPPGQKWIRVDNMTIPVRANVLYIGQKCAEPIGHSGHHRSQSNVITESSEGGDRG